MPHVKNLIIFQEHSHAEKISKYQGTKEGLVVSFSVEGKLALDKKGIKCSYPDELIELPDLNQIGINNIERAKKICSFLDKKLCEKFTFLKENNINIFLGNFYNVKIFLDALYTSYFILERLLGEIRAEKIVIFKRPCSLDGLVRGQESIVPALMENVFSRNHDSASIILNNKVDFKDLFPFKLKNALKNVCDLFSYKGKKKKRCNGNGIILMDTHDIPFVTEKILDDLNFYKLYLKNPFIKLHSLYSRNLGMRIRSRKNKVYDDLIAETFREVLSDKQYRDMFIGGDDLFYFTNKCFEKYFLQTMSYILPYAGDIKKWVISLAPKAVITSGCRLNLMDAFVLGLAKSLKIPVVTYQEGGGAGYLDWPLFDLDMDLSNYFLAYGNGVKESAFTAGKAEVIPVGSIRLANIKKHIEIKTTPCVTIYVVLDLFKTSTWQHYPYNGGFFSQAYAHQLNILNILKQFKTAKFVIKTTKGREFLYKNFIDRNFMKIITRPLVSVLDKASAFILDWPSTVLQECLLTDRPIALLYNEDCACFDRNALNLLNKRVRMAADIRQFYGVVKSLIEDAEYGSGMVKENEFLNEYCVMKDPYGNLKDFFSSLHIGSFL